MLIFFGSSGDLAYLQQLSDHEGFQREVLAQHSLGQGRVTGRLLHLPPHHLTLIKHAIASLPNQWWTAKG